MEQTKKKYKKSAITAYNTIKPYKHNSELWKNADEKCQHMIGYSPRRENQWKGNTVDLSHR